MKKYFLFPLLLLASPLSFAGTTLLNPTNVPHSITLPATCSQGDMYQDSDATTGQQWYLCESANTWKQQGGSGGGSGASVYPATATATFPFGLTSSTITGTGVFKVDDNSSTHSTLTFDPTGSAPVLILNANSISASENEILYEKSSNDYARFSATPVTNPVFTLALSTDTTGTTMQGRIQIFGNGNTILGDKNGSSAFLLNESSVTVKQTLNAPSIQISTDSASRPGNALNVNYPPTTNLTSVAVISSTAPAMVPLMVRTASGQTANPIEVRDNTNTLLFNVDSVGAVKLGSYNGFTLVDSRGVAGGNGGIVFVNAAGTVAWAPQSTGNGMQVERDSAYNWTSVALAAYQVPDTGMVRPAAKVIAATDGTTANAGWFTDAGIKRVSTQFDKTSDAALANVTGLSVTVQAGRTYTFNATLFTTSNVGGGVQAAIGGTATATAIIYEGETTAGAAIGAQGRATALGSSVGSITTVTAARIDIGGTITVNAAGTLTVQFAQNTSNIAASSVLVGSYFIVRDNP